MSDITSYIWIASTVHNISTQPIFFFELRNAADLTQAVGSHYFNLTSYQEAPPSQSPSSTQKASTTAPPTSSPASTGTLSAIAQSPSTTIPATSTSHTNSSKNVDLEVGLGVGLGLSCIFIIALTYWCWRRRIQTALPVESKDLKDCYTDGPGFISPRGPIDTALATKTAVEAPTHTSPKEMFLEHRYELDSSN